MIRERSFLEEAIPQCLKELIKDMVGAHVHMSNIGNGGGENGKEEFEEPSAELGRSLRPPSVSSLLLL